MYRGFDRCGRRSAAITIASDRSGGVRTVYASKRIRPSGQVGRSRRALHPGPTTVLTRCGMSLHGVTDIDGGWWASTAPGRQPECRGTAAVSLDRLVGPLQERRRDREAERLRGFEVDHQLKLGGLLDRQIGRLPS